MVGDLHGGLVFVVVGLVLGSAAGCDQVFGLDGNGAGEAGLDGGSDGPGSSPDAHTIGVASALMNFAIADDPNGAPLATLDVRSASATILGTPHTFVPYSLAAPSGAFSPASGEVEIGDGGSIVLASTFTASGMPVSPATATLTSGAMASAIPAATVGLTHLGPSNANGGAPMAAGDRAGVQVQTSGNHYLKRVGVVVGAATNAYLGIYADATNAPGTLLVSVGPVALTAGLNEPVVNNVLLPPTFWVVVTFQTAVTLTGANASSSDRFYHDTSSYGPLPASLSVGSVSTGLQFLQYVLAAP